MLFVWVDDARRLDVGFCVRHELRRFILVDLTRTLFWQGARRGLVNSLPFYIVMVPFGILFGVIATEAGLSVAQVMGFSVAVLAGAAQITAVTLMTDNAPTVIILATSLAVNLRMGMYSAALVPLLGKAKLWQRAIVAYWIFDQSYAVTAIEAEKRKEMTLHERLGVFFGVAIPISFLWYLGTYLGAVLGAQIPVELGLDFAVPITFLALVAPLLRSLPHLCAAVTSIVGTLLLVDLPFSSGLLVAALLALTVGYVVERLLETRQIGVTK